MAGTTMTLRSSKRKNVKQTGSAAKRQKKTESFHPKWLGSLKMTDVNDDCLQYVFEYLNLNDLINVANANRHLVSAARLVYQRKYNNRFLEIRNSCRVLSLSKSSQYENVHHWREVERVIAKQCTETLTEIHLLNPGTNIMEEIRKPFEKIEFLEISNRPIEATSVNLIDKFRFLKQFKFETCKWNKYVEDEVWNFVRSNPQIKLLSISGNYRPIHINPSFFKFLSEALPQLEVLHLKNLHFMEIDYELDIHFPTVDVFHLCSVRLPKNILITFCKLKELKLSDFLGDLKWMDFIKQNEQLTHLYIQDDSQGVTNVVDFIRLVNDLPNLNAFYLPTSINLIQFLNACKLFHNLKTIRIFNRGYITLSKIEELVDDKFKSIYEGSFPTKPIQINVPWIEFHRKSN